jgi:hypothetical protein
VLSPADPDAGAFAGLSAPGAVPTALPRSAPPPLPEDGRQRRWRLSDGLRRLLVDRGIRNGITGCGFTVPRRGDDDGQAHAAFRRERDRAGRPVIAVDNLGWCGSARCVRCAPLVAEKVQGRVQEVLDAARERNFGVAFLTLTASHDRSTALADARRDFSALYTGLQQDCAWKRERKAGLLGIVRFWEVTWGARTGWHLHPHCLVLHCDGPEAAVAAGERLIARWRSGLARRGWRTERAAQDVRVVSDAGGLPDYGTKGMTGWGAAAELAAGWRKEGRRPHRMTLPQLLGLALAGDRQAADRFAEAVTALSGQRLFVLGPRLAKSLGIAPAAIADGDAVQRPAPSARPSPGFRAPFRAGWRRRRPAAAGRPGP